MPDKAQAVGAPQHERPAAAPERAAARTDAGGSFGASGFAVPLGQAVDLARLLPRLGAADLASRAKTVLGLQRSLGNAAISWSLRSRLGAPPQRNVGTPVVQRQRGVTPVPAAPAGPTPAATPAPATPAPGREEAAEAEEAQPVQQPDEFDHGLLKAVEVAARIAHLPKAEQNSRSATYRDLMALVPGQWIDSRFGTIRADVANFLVEKWLPARARQMVDTMLDDSEQRATKEGQRYEGAQGEGDAKGLRQAASELAKTEAETRRRIDDIRSEQLHKTMYPRGEAAGIGAGSNMYESAAIREQAVKAEAEVRQDFERMKRAYGARFPVLLAEGLDFAAVAKAGADTLQGLVAPAVKKTLENIGDTRENLKKGLIDVWDLEPVIARVKEHYGVEPGSYADQVINKQREARAKKGFWEGIAVAVLMIGMGVVAVVATGGVALVAFGVGATLSTAQAVSHIVDYQVKKAAHGSDLDVARAISAESPSLLWLAFDIVGAVLDIAAATKAFKTIAVEAENFRRLKAVAREEGQRLADTGKLKIEGEVTDKAKAKAVDDFVNRIVKSARATRGAAAKRAMILTELLRGSGARAVSILAGEERAMVGLLKEWGNWKELMLALEHGTPDMNKMAGKLLEFREGVVAKLERAPAEGGIGAIRAGKPSAELVSDVDLSVRTGDEMIKAEAYMARTYGPNWSKMLRVNFYTEATRLYKYGEVMKRLGRGARAALQTRITATAERLNLAKMLRHAGTDTESVARVQSFIKTVVKDKADLAKIGELAAVKEAEGLARRDQRLREVDGLVKKFESATKDEQVHLAEEITQKQMEANFWTEEATIGPGGAREVVAGVRVIGPEAYQSALSWLEGIEHELHAAGGDIAKAAREYEFFKYVNRFAVAAGRAGVKSKVLTYFENLSEYLYRVYRGAHAEIPPGLPEDWLKRPFVRPSDRIAFPVPRVGDEFLHSQFNEFVQEARTALPKIKEKAMATAAEWAPAPAP